MSRELQDIRIFENPDPRCACALVLDTSLSMQGDRISELNRGLVTLKESLMRDPYASRRVELAVITFDSDIRVVQQFAPVEQFAPPVLTAQNLTFMGAAVIQALDLIEARKDTYKRNGVKYYRPWLLLITDGEPEGEPDDIIEEAKRRVRADTGGSRVVIQPVGVGDDANLAKLQDITNATPARLRGLDFHQLFVWLSASMKSVSQSQPGSQLALSPINNWGQV